MLKQLEIFCYVYQEKSFSKAAECLDISQPTVSVQIKALEDILKMRLFNRLGRKIEATQAGHVLYEQARSLLEVKQNLLARMERLLETPQGPLVVGASTVPAEYLLPEVLCRFREENPRAQIQIVVDHSQGIIEQVGAGTLPIGIVGGQINEPNLEYRPVATDRLVFAMPCREPRGRQRTITREDLREIPLLCRESGSGTQMFLEQRLKAYGLALDDLHVVAKFGSNSALKEGIRAGLGAGFVSDLSIVLERRIGLLSVADVQGLPPLERNFFYVLDGRRTISSVVGTFLSQFETLPRTEELARGAA